MVLLCMLLHIKEFSDKYPMDMMGSLRQIATDYRQLIVTKSGDPLSNLYCRKSFIDLLLNSPLAISDKSFSTDKFVSNLSLIAISDELTTFFFSVADTFVSSNVFVSYFFRLDYLCVIFLFELSICYFPFGLSSCYVVV